MPRSINGYFSQRGSVTGTSFSNPWAPCEASERRQRTGHLRTGYQRHQTCFDFATHALPLYSRVITYYRYNQNVRLILCVCKSLQTSTIHCGLILASSWYGRESDKKSVYIYKSHRVRSVVIMRDISGNFRGIKTTSLDGRPLRDESKLTRLEVLCGRISDAKAVSNYWKNQSKHPHPVHREYTAHIHDVDGDGNLPKNCIKLNRDEIDPRFPKYYSFSSDKGNPMICQISNYNSGILTEI